MNCLFLEFRKYSLLAVFLVREIYIFIFCYFYIILRLDYITRVVSFFYTQYNYFFTRLWVSCKKLELKVSALIPVHLTKLSIAIR